MVMLGSVDGATMLLADDHISVQDDNYFHPPPPALSSVPACTSDSAGAEGKNL